MSLAASHVRMLWADNSNLTRCRVVPAHRFLLPNFKVGLTSAIQSFPFLHDVPIDAPVGLVEMGPDRTSVVEHLPWAPDSAVCFGDMTMSGLPWDICPRTFLRKQETLLRESFDLTLSLGFEIEFVLLDPKSGAPVDKTLYCEARSLDGSNAGWGTLKQIIMALEEMGIPIWQYHSESAPGQFEVAIGPFTESVVLAADALVLARQAIYAIAAKYGYQATMIAKPFPNEAGSACHFHLGLHHRGSPLSLFAESQDLATFFLAGVLDQIPALCMITAPTTLSYERLVPGCWAGAYHCYGFENKEAPLRLIAAAPSLSQVERFELKMIDGACNPYLALGCILAAGMEGLKKCLGLPPPTQVDPQSLPEEERPARLPSSLKDAITLFEGNELWNRALGAPYVSLLAKLRSIELEHCETLGPALTLDLLKQRY